MVRGPDPSTPVVVELDGRKARGWYRLSGHTLVVRAENYLGEDRAEIDESADPAACEALARQLLRALLARASRRATSPGRAP